MTAKTLCVLDGIAYSANDLRQIIAERNEAVEQLTSRLKQSHELRRALDALELHRIPELEAKIERLEKMLDVSTRQNQRLMNQHLPQRDAEIDELEAKIERLEAALKELPFSLGDTVIAGYQPVVDHNKTAKPPKKD